MRRDRWGTGPSSELAAVDAGYRFGAGPRLPVSRQRAWRAHARISCSAGCLTVAAIIELKQGDPDLARAVHDVLRRTDSTARVCVGSFHQMGLDVLRTLSPLGAHERVRTRSPLDAVSIVAPLAFRQHSACTPRSRCRSGPGSCTVISPPFLAQAHRNGARVDVWVVDQPEDVDAAVRCRRRWRDHRSPRPRGARAGMPGSPDPCSGRSSNRRPWLEDSGCPLKFGRLRPAAAVWRLVITWMM